MNYKLGAHLSISGGYLKPLEKIKEIGGNTLQIFSSSPMQWIDAHVSPEQVKEFLWAKNSLAINPIYFHACYLLNLADAEYIGEKSVQSLIHELILASKMDVKGSVVHVGSFKEKATDQTKTLPENGNLYEIVVDNIKTVLDATPSPTLFIIENAGNRKIGKDLVEIGTIMKKVNNDRVRVCLDICHLHAAGYDFSTAEKLDEFLALFDRIIGLDKLELFHCNDSRDTKGSLRDRHANIGVGHVGIDTFRLLLTHPLLKDKPFILETPGFEKKGPDKENMDRLKQLIPSLI